VVRVVGRPPRIRPPPPLTPLLRGAPWPTVSHPWSGRISMWPYQGQGGGLVPRTSRQPRSRVLPPTRRPGLHLRHPAHRGRGWWWDQAALAQSFSTVGLTPPVGTEWIADSGASYHTTPDAGILSSVRPPHPSCPSSIMVGEGSCLPSLLWVLLPVLFVSLMSLLLLKWFIIFFLFVNLQLTILVLWSLTLLVFL
jgi:hypothetical protein